jgi:hypothetical protein
MCDLIVKAVKTKKLKQEMYPSGSPNATDFNADGCAKKKTSKKKKKKKNGAKLVCVTKKGTYYHFLLTFFAQDLHHLIAQLGHQPSKSQLV